MSAWNACRCAISAASSGSAAASHAFQAAASRGAAPSTSPAVSANPASVLSRRAPGAVAATSSAYERASARSPASSIQSTARSNRASRSAGATLSRLAVISAVAAVGRRAALAPREGLELCRQLCVRARRGRGPVAERGRVVGRQIRGGAVRPRAPPGAERGQHRRAEQRVPEAQAALPVPAQQAGIDASSSASNGSWARTPSPATEANSAAAASVHGPSTATASTSPRAAGEHPSSRRAMIAAYGRGAGKLGLGILPALRRQLVEQRAGVERDAAGVVAQALGGARRQCPPSASASRWTSPASSGAGLTPGQLPLRDLGQALGQLARADGDQHEHRLVREPASSANSSALSDSGLAF